jgi:hypothetical protein
VLVDALLLVVFKVGGGAAALALFWYVLYRGVLDARKKAGRAGVGGQLMATVLTLFSGTALDPAREVAAESQKLKRNQDGNGDPESDSRP